MTIKHAIYDYAVSYVKINGDSEPMDIVDSFIRTHPDVKPDVKNLRSKLTAAVTDNIDYYGDRAPIIRFQKGVYRYNGE